MMAPEIWLAFALAASVISVIPGPTILLVIAKALAHGRRAALPLTFGVIAGDTLALLLCVAGLGALLTASSAVFTLIKWLGAAYLIWLGITLWRAPPLAAAPDAVHAAAEKNRKSLFLHTFVVTALNPKSILFFIAFLPQFVDTGGNAPLQLGVLGATFVAIGGINALGYALFAGNIKRHFARQTASRRMRRCGAVALVGAGVWAATAQRA
ncbi:MAG: LysE family translocator [Gammaproteobacteria bacterium]